MTDTRACPLDPWIEPEADLWQEVPDRLAERAGQMRHGRVGHNDEVEPVDRRGRVREVVQQGGQIDDERVSAPATASSPARGPSAG